MTKRARTQRTVLLKRNNRMGYLFISPFILGFVLFFAFPLIQSIKFSFSEVEIGRNGFWLNSVKFANYHKAFFIDPEFNRILVESVQSMFVDLPLIIFFSLFASTLLNQKFKGRAFARAIFFIPVIVTSGVLLSVESSDLLSNFMNLGLSEKETGGPFSLFNYREITAFLLESQLNQTLVFYILDAISHIYMIVSSCGVQILIFLAGLQSIPASIYEASKIEGATAWESFWKITFPMISSLILVNIIYSIIDTFTKSTNLAMNYIQKLAFTPTTMGYSSALSWIYFIVIFLLLLIIGSWISRKVFYYE